MIYKTTRPNRYFVDLFRQYHYTLTPKIIEKILDSPQEVASTIVERYMNQYEWGDCIPRDDFDSQKHWVIYNIDDGESILYIALHEWAQNFMDGFLKFDMLPDTLPNGDRIGTKDVKTFDDFIEILSKVNPFWILEVYTYTYLGRDFARCHPEARFDYNVNEEEVKEIRIYLRKLIEDL